MQTDIRGKVTSVPCSFDCLTPFSDFVDEVMKAVQVGVPRRGRRDWVGRPRLQR